VQVHRLLSAVSLCVALGLCAGCTPSEVAQWLGVNEARHENGWLSCVRERESHGTYDINTGNGYYGAYQYLPGTWNSAARATGHPELADGRPDLHSPSEQDAVTLGYAQQTGGSPWAGDLRYCGRP
jgi:hypothetical protein